MSTRQRIRIGSAMSALVRSVSYYERIDVALQALVDQWRTLSPDQRIAVAGISSSLVDHLLVVEARVDELADA